MSEAPFPHALERRIVIRARRDTVFRHFTDSALWAAWWGAGSTIEPRVGGRVLVRHPGAVEAAGEVLVLEPPARIAFTYGFTSGQPMPVGASRVTITLEEIPEGTRLDLRHEFADAAARDHHVQGWRYQLSVFAGVVSELAQGAARERVDAWFAAWSEPDAARRAALLARTVAPTIRFRDRYSDVEGIGDLEPHLAAVHVFMPGARVARTGEIRRCQGTVLADWIAHGGDGAELGRGANVFELDADGRIDAVVGLWGPPGA